MDSRITKQAQEEDNSGTLILLGALAFVALGIWMLVTLMTDPQTKAFMDFLLKK